MILGRCPRPRQGSFLKKAPLKPAKTFEKRGDGRNRASENRSLSGRCPGPRQGGFLKKAPLEPAKTFGKGETDGIEQAQPARSRGSAPDPARAAFEKAPETPQNFHKKGESESVGRRNVRFWAFKCVRYVIPQ